VDDLHRWYRTLSAAQLISPRATALLFARHYDTSKRFGQGFGWLVYDSTSAGPVRSAPTPGRRRSGREAGFESELVHNPGAGWTAVILANTDENTWRIRALDLVGAVMAAQQRN
jgi:hypothetical protein